MARGNAKHPPGNPVHHPNPESLDKPPGITDNRAMLAAVVHEKLSGKPRLKIWALALLSGLLMAYSTPPHYLPGLGLVALVPLLLALPRLSAGGAFCASYLGGMIYVGANTWWLAEFTTTPGNEYVIVGMWVASVIVRGFSIGVAGLCLRWLLTRQWRYAVWLIPLCWLGLEFTHEFNIPGPYPWLSVAYCLAWFGPFLQTADIWGIYGITASMILFNLAAASLFSIEGSQARLGLRRSGHNRYALPVAASLVAILGTVYGLVQIERYSALERTDGPLVGLVQGNLAQEVKVLEDENKLPRSYSEHLALTQVAVKGRAELVCWPETMVFRGSTRDGHYFWGEDSSRAQFKDGVPSQSLRNSAEFTEFYISRLRAEIYHELKTPMLVGVVTPIPPEEQDEDWKDYGPRRHNSAMLLDSSGNLGGIYDKRNLVPGGENIPHEGNFLFRWITTKYSEQLQGSVSLVEPGRRSTRFSIPSKAERLGGKPWVFTSTICYEYAFPRTHADLALNGSDCVPDFNVNLSNEGWFKQSSELDHAVLYSRLRAIETRVPQLRCTNTGITCSIDACGRVRETLRVNGTDREVQGLLLVRPCVIERRQADDNTWFVNRLGGGLGFLGWIVNFHLFAFMLVGRVQERLRRRTRALPANTSEEAPLRP